MLMGSTEALAPRRRPMVWLPIVFLLLSATLSLALLAVRNIYDDEIATVDLLPVATRQIVATMNHTDVHPPGMYVLGHLGYLLLPSARWVTVFPLLCLYGGLAVFVLTVAPLFRGLAARVGFLMFATLHPQLSMWGNSIRWYPWWTGLALLTVTVALQPGVGEAIAFSWKRACGVGVLLACLFYLNYITIVFGVALLTGMIVRYGRRAWMQFLLAAAMAGALILPQLRAFLTVHLQGSGEQRSNPLLSAARLAQSLFTSEAFLPWHPVALVAALLSVMLVVCGAVQGSRFLRRQRWKERTGEDQALASLLVLGLCFLLLVGVTGLGGKPRNGLALIPLLAPGAGLIVGGLRRPLLHAGVLGLLAVWMGWGTAHLLLREGITKSGMNNRPEEVERFIEKTRGSGCSVVVTYDPILSFYLAERRLPRQLILTFSQNAVYRDVPRFVPVGCSAMKLYVVQSYLGGYGGYQTILPEQLRVATGFLRTPLQVSKFSYDPDASMKRRLRFVSGSASLPDFRYMVGWGAMDPRELEALESSLGYFTVADGHTAPRLQ